MENFRCIGRSTLQWNLPILTLQALKSYFVICGILRSKQNYTTISLRSICQNYKRISPTSYWGLQLVMYNPPPSSSADLLLAFLGHKVLAVKLTVSAESNLKRADNICHHL